MSSKVSTPISTLLGALAMYVVAARLASAMRAPPMLSLVSIARIETRLIALLLEAATASDLTVVAADRHAHLGQVDGPGPRRHRHQQADAVGGGLRVVDGGRGPTASTAYDGEATPETGECQQDRREQRGCPAREPLAGPAVHRNSMVAKIRGSTVTLLCCIFSRNFGRRPVALSEPRERPSRSKPAELS